MPNSTTGLRRIINATGYSMAGLKAAWQHEAAFRQELGLTIVLTPVALWLGRNSVEIAILIATCLLVVVTELLNSALEALTDRVGEERHELAGRAKDMGSAAVMISLLLMGIVWASVVIDRFL